MMKGRQFGHCGVVLILLIIAGGVLSLGAGPVSADEDIGNVSAAIERDASHPKAFSERPSGDWAHDISDLRPDPNVVFGKFSNGSRYVLMPNGKPDNRTSMHLVIEVGSLYETDDERGVAVGLAIAYVLMR